MKSKFTGITTIAAAVSLALGSSAAFAQQADEPVDQRFEQEQRSEVEQRSGLNQPSAEQLPNADAQSAADARSQEFPEAETRTDANADSQADSQASDREPFSSLTEQQPELSKFVEAVEAAGLTESLSDGTEFTIFAPTNDALASEDIDSLLEQEDRQELVALLRAHIVADDVSREMAGRIGAAKTIDGGTVDLSVDGEKLMIGDAEAMDAEIEIGNIRVYAVDSVLPSNPTAQSARNEIESTNSVRDSFGDSSDRISGQRERSGVQ